jgi:predicted enzyme related to lactoylglutathione lyase
MQFSGILIGSEHPERLAEYYTRLFGEPGWNDGGYVGWLIGGAGVTVGPHDQVKGANGEAGRIIWNVDSPDVRADFARFKSAGAIVVREPYNFEQAPDTWIATFADPDGNYFQLVTPMTM